MELSAENNDVTGDRFTSPIPFLGFIENKSVPSTLIGNDFMHAKSLLCLIA